MSNLLSKMATAVVAIFSFVVGMLLCAVVYELSPSEKDEVILRMTEEIVRGNELVRDMDYLDLYGQYDLKLEILKELEKTSTDEKFFYQEVAALENAIPSLECMSAKITDNDMRATAEKRIIGIKEYIEKTHNKSSKREPTPL